jgi:hypothetical protein
MLWRRVRLDSVNVALDSGRYLEILGDAGVGKSGILRSLAEQAAMGANIIVLSPTRTIPRGWAAMRQAIGYDGSAKDLLSEIAASGGATLFLDSVDFFGDAERAAVSDLVREAAAVPTLGDPKRSHQVRLKDLGWLESGFCRACGHRYFIGTIFNFCRAWTRNGDLLRGRPTHQPL